MKKALTPLCLTLISATVLPLMIVRTVPPSGAFAFFVIELLVLFPLTAVGLGIYAGLRPKERWWYAVLFLGLFLLSAKTLIGMDWGDTGFYLVCYLGIEALSAGLTVWIAGAVRRKKG